MSMSYLWRVVFYGIFLFCGLNIRGEDFWEPTGLLGKETAALAVDSSGVLWAAARFNEDDLYDLYRSSDNGDTWTLIRADISGAGYSGPPKLSAGLNGDLWVGTDRGLYRLSIQDNTWTTTSLAGRIFGLGFLQDSYLYAANDYGSFRSNDYGSSWVDLGLRISLRSIVMDGGGAIYAAADSVLRSKDAGKSWEGVLGLEASSDLTGAYLAVSPTGAVFSGYSGFYGGRLYRSDDGGTSWTQVLETAIRNIVIAPARAIFVGGGWIGQTRGVYQSLDNGEHWMIINSGFPHPEDIMGVTSLALADNHHTLFAAVQYGARENSGIYRSRDGALSSLYPTSSQNHWCFYY